VNELLVMGVAFAIVGTTIFNVNDVLLNVKSILRITEILRNEKPGAAMMLAG
jgi:hypothetical protein